MTDDEKQLTAVVLGQRGDDESLLASQSRGADEAFLLESVQRAPHGCSAQAQPVDDGTLGDPRAGRKLSRDDQRAQLVIDA